MHTLVPAVTGAHDFQVSVLVLGAVLACGALVAGLARESVLSLAAVFVLVGFGLGTGGAGVLHFDARSSFVADLATVALIVILFRDGLEVEGEMLQEHWRLPLRKLVLAMPLTAGIIAVAARTLDLAVVDRGVPARRAAVPDRPGAVLERRHQPPGPATDPPLAEPRVRAQRRAGSARRARAGGGAEQRQRPLRVVAVRAAGRDCRVRHRDRRRVRGRRPAALETRLRAGIPDHQRALYALGTAFAAYGIAVLPPKGNGLIAVYVAAITLGIRRPDVRAYFERHAEVLVEIVKLGIFVVFGSLLTLHGLFADGWAAVAIVVVVLLIARPVAVLAALAGTATDLATRGFMAWFGPKGVATMTFSLLVLGDRIAAGSRLFNLAALVVVCSVILHGLTDTPGAEWIARRAESARAAVPQ